MSDIPRRTPFKPRTTRLTRTPWRPRGGPIPRTTTLKARGKKGSLFPHRRCRPFMDYVRTLRCILAGKPGHECKGDIDPSHVNGRGAGHNDIGEVLPLCRWGHTKGPKCWHDIGRHSFPAYWGFGTLEVMQGMARELGREWVAANPELASGYMYDLEEAA